MQLLGPVAVEVAAVVEAEAVSELVARPESRELEPVQAAAVKAAAAAARVAAM